MPPPARPSAEVREEERTARVKRLMLDAEQNYMPPSIQLEGKTIAYLQAGVPNPLPREVLRKVIEMWVDKGSAPILSIELTREITKGLMR